MQQEERKNGVRLCPCSHENRLALNQLLPCTAPAAFGREGARRHYEVHCDLRNVPPLDTVEDAQLPEYLTQNDARQLMHITYGHILSKPELKAEIFRFLSENRALYETEAEELYRRHLNALGVYGPRAGAHTPA